MIPAKKTTNPGEGTPSSLLHAAEQLDQQLQSSAAQPVERSVLADVVAPQSEQIASVEQQSPTEQAFEQYKQVDDTKPEESPYVIRSARAKKPAAPAMTDAQTKAITEIEEIMAEDLGSVYQTMTPQQQAKFKAKGEEVAKTIVEMITQVGFTVKKVLKLIRDWLKLIPKVNKYFLEQEAKIKADELMKYAKSHYSK